jgi:hypothetical protein
MLYARGIAFFYISDTPLLAMDDCSWQHTVASHLPYLWTVTVAVKEWLTAVPIYRSKDGVCKQDIERS